MYSPGGPGAVLVLEVPTAADGVAAIAGLPLVASAEIEPDFIELRPFSAFEMLFADQERT